MSDPHPRATAGLASIFLALGVLLAQGCSTASAAGCGVGVLSGMALAGLALVSAGDQDSVNAGAVVAGGGLFGLVSGCSAAAAADAIARSDEQKRARREQAEMPVRDQERIPVTRGSAPTSDVIQTQADLNGLKVSWFGAPAISAEKVGMRFQRYGRQPVLASCSEIEIRIDERSVRYPWRRNTNAFASMVQETAHIETDIATVRAMAAARAVELDLCGLRRRLNVAAIQAASEFTGQFTKLAPVEPLQPSAPLPGAVPEPAAEPAPADAAADVPEP